MLEFVDDHGNEVLNLGSFTLLPEHVVRLILVREELKADEFSKFQVMMEIPEYLLSITYPLLGSLHVEQEVLRQHGGALARGPQPLPRLHQVPHDPCQCPHDRDSSSGPGALQVGLMLHIFAIDT